MNMSGEESLVASNGTSTPPPTQTTQAAAMSPPLLTKGEVRLMIFFENIAHFNWAFVVVVTSFGCVANCFNMIVFRKLGLNESVNVAFFGIASADFVSCVFSALYALSAHPEVKKLIFVGISIKSGDVSHVVFTPCLIMSGMVGALITAYMAIQRCLCVALPLKVKAIFTSRRTKIVIVGVVLLVAGTRLPYFSLYLLGWIRDPRTNATLYFGMSYSTRKTNAAILAFSVTAQTVLTFSISSVIIICSIILWIHLITKSNWRKEFTDNADKVNNTNTNTAASDNTATSSNKKETKIAKTVVLICTIYIICSVPTVAFAVYYLVDDSLMSYLWHPYYAALFDFMYQITLVSQSINISANILIYYNVSSQFHETFNKNFSFHRLCTNARGGLQKD